MKNTKKTSMKVSSLASKVLKSNSSSKTAKQLAASALSQRQVSKQTGSKLEDLASTVLSSDKYNERTKTLAGTVLSQSNKER